MTFLAIMGRYLEVTDRRMAAAVKLVLAQPLIAGTPSLVRDVRGDCMLNRRAFAQRGASALGLDLGAELVLEWFVFPDRQASPLADLGGGTLRALGAPSADAGRELGGFA